MSLKALILYFWGHIYHNDIFASNSYSFFNLLFHDFLTFCQANAEKMCKTHEVHLAELQAKIDEQSRSMSELSSTKSKMMNENDDLHSQLEDAESQLGQLSKVC